MLALQALTPEALAARIPGLSSAHARKIVSAVHRDLPIGEATFTIRRSVIEAILASTTVPTLECVEEQKSAIDSFVKYGFRTHDGHVIETVRIPLEKKGRFTVCVSSQVGCALACTFCATGRMGLTRNLESWEILEQVRHVRRSLNGGAEKAGHVYGHGHVYGGDAGRVHGVVFQGMGEPMANIERVLEAIFVMGDPSAMAIDMRAITVCTSGIPTGIRRLAREAPKVRLALSLSSARPDVRKSLMPIARAHSLEEIIDASVEHARITGLAPMWAVTLLNGQNDSEEDARALGELVRGFVEKSGKSPRISVIPYNAIAPQDDPYSRTTEEREARFRETLRDSGVHTRKRYSGGGDVDGACGQLAAAQRESLPAPVATT